MNCRDINKLLANPGRLPAGAREHAESCPRCRPLLAETPPPGLLDQLERNLAADFEPVTPLRSAMLYGSVWAAIFGALVIYGSIRLHPLALPRMGPATSILVLAVLVTSALLLIVSLTRQMTPGSRYRLPPGALPGAILLAAALMFFLLFPFEVKPNFWHQGWKCFSVGIVYGAAAGALIWITLRRGAFTDPPLAGATAGLLAGLTGLTVLSIHCPLLEISHVVGWHVGAAAVSTLAGAALATMFTRRTATRARASY